MLFQLFGQEAQLDWIIFHDVLVTSRVYVRTVCPIRYDWVKDLLPKLHEIDVYDLSNVAREEVTDEEMARWEKKRVAQKQMGMLHSNKCCMAKSLWPSDHHTHMCLFNYSFLVGFPLDFGFAHSDTIAVVRSGADVTLGGLWLTRGYSSRCSVGVRVGVVVGVEGSPKFVYTNQGFVLSHVFMGTCIVHSFVKVRFPQTLHTMHNKSLNRGQKFTYCHHAYVAYISFQY